MRTKAIRCGSVLLAAMAAIAGAARAADKHPFNFDDYTALHRAVPVAVSPDGKTILYAVSFEGTKGPEKHEWRLIGIAGDGERKLDLPEKFQPAGFTKDGAALYGIFEVDGKGQLAIVPLAPDKATLRSWRSLTEFARPRLLRMARATPCWPTRAPRIRSLAFIPSSKTIRRASM